MSTEIMIHTNNSIAEQTEVGEELFRRFIAYLDAAPKTIESYTRQLRQMFKYFADNGITHPQREDIIAFREYLKASGHKPTTVQNYIIAVRQFFTWTEVEGLYPNIAEHIKGAKLDREHKKDYLTAAQIKAILDAIERDTLTGKRDYAIMALMVSCGLRTVEVARADINDIGTVGGNTVLYVQGKGHEEKAEYVILPAQTEQAIRAYLKARGKATEDAPLFTSTSNNNRGQRMTTRSISGIVKTRMQNAGYDSERLTAHSLRHTAVTLALLGGMPLEEAQQYARHANIATTMIYNHSLDKARNRCSAVVADAIF